MDKLTHIGPDVHKDTIAVAILRAGATECDERVVPNTPEAIRRLFSHYLVARNRLRRDRALAHPQALRRAREDRRI